MAELFKWSDQYSVGVEEIDEDHKQLVRILNRVVQSIRDDKSKDQVREIMDELIDYTRYHFSHEESLMEKTGYPGLEQHRASHELLVWRVIAFHQKVLQETIDMAEVANFLVEWLINHILDEDARFAPHFRQHGIK